MLAHLSTYLDTAFKWTVTSVFLELVVAPTFGCGGTSVTEVQTAPPTMSVPLTVEPTATTENNATPPADRPGHGMIFSGKLLLRDYS